MSTARRRQALLNAFDKHEEMMILLTCLARSPAVWAGDDDDDDEDEDDEQYDIKERLEARGLLSDEGEFYTTTAAGRAALVAYINGTDEDDEEV